MPTDQPHCQDSGIDPHLLWEGSVRWKRHDVGRRQLTSQCSSAYIPQEKGHPDLPRVGRAHACSVPAAMVEVLCSDQSLWTHYFHCCFGSTRHSFTSSCMRSITVRSTQALVSVLNLACLTTTCINTMTSYHGGISQSPEPQAVLRCRMSLKNGKSKIKNR